MFALFTILACASGNPPASPAPTSAEAPKTQTEAGKRTDTDIAGLEKAIADKALIIDVRTDPEWAKGHVPGAVHAPLSDISADHAVLKGHDKSTPVYLICEAGGRSGQAADRLAKAGYNTVNVQGGTGAWRNAGKPLETP